MTEPTDAEIWQMWMPMVRRMGVADPVEFARAVLAKWGTPAVAGEPVAWVDERAIGWLANSRSGAATITTTLGRQKSFERPMPLHTTPQPAQAQAGAVPLTDDQLAEMMRETWGCASIAPRHAMKFARAIEAAHGIGIKGGQHGAE